MSKAIKAKSTAVAKVAPARSITLIDQELKNEVADIKQQIGASSGRMLKIEARGAFTTPDGLDLGNEIQIVVLDFVTRHQFYTSPFSPDQPSAPDCYAIGKVIADLAPENDSPNRQADGCAGCALNQFGSGSNGRSKACQNRRELAVLLVDPENPDAHNAPDAPIYVLSLSPTALKSFDGAVAAVARSLDGPPIKAILTVRAQNKGTYAEVSFSHPMPNPDYAAHAARRAECHPALFRKPDFAAIAAKARPVRAPVRRVANARR